MVNKQRVLMQTMGMLIALILLLGIIGIFSSKLNNAQEAAMRGDSKAVQETAEQIQKTAQEALVKAPLLGAGILLIIGLVSVAIYRNKIRVFEKAMAVAASDNSLSIKQETMFEYPSATGTDGKSTIHIETVKTEKQPRTTQLHLTLPHYTTPATISKKKEEGSKATLKKISEKTKNTLKNEKGTWHINPNEVIYEEEGLLTDPDKLHEILTKAQTIREELYTTR